MLVGKPTKLSTAIIDALKTSKVAVINSESDLNTLISNNPKPIPKTTYPYIIINSAFNEPREIKELNKNIIFLYPLIGKNTKLLLLLPGSQYYSYSKSSTNISDKLGHLLKTLGQLSNSVSFTVKTLIINDVINDPQIDPSTSIINYLISNNSKKSQGLKELIFFPTDIFSASREALKR